MRVGRGESQAEIIGQKDLNSAKIIRILTGRSIRSVRKGVLNIFKYSDFKILLLDFHSLLCLGSIIKCTSLIFTPPWMIKTWKPSLSYFRQESIRLGFFGIQSCLSGGERFSMEVSLPYWGEEWEEKSSSRSNMKVILSIKSAMSVCKSPSWGLMTADTHLRKWRLWPFVHPSHS